MARKYVTLDIAIAMSFLTNKVDFCSVIWSFGKTASHWNKTNILKYWERKWWKIAKKDWKKKHKMQTDQKMKHNKGILDNGKPKKTYTQQKE